MRIRLVSDQGKKPWAVIIEGPNGEQIEKRDYQSRETAEKGRDKLARDLRGESEPSQPTNPKGQAD